MLSNPSASSGRPMNVLVFYGTTEGQTRKIAQFVSDRLDVRGHEARLIDGRGRVTSIQAPSAPR